MNSDIERLQRSRELLGKILSTSQQEGWRTLILWCYNVQNILESMASQLTTASPTTASPLAAPERVTTIPTTPKSLLSDQSATQSGLAEPRSKCAHLWIDRELRRWSAGIREPDKMRILLECYHCGASQLFDLIPVPAAPPTSSISAKPETPSSAAPPPVAESPSSASPNEALFWRPDTTFGA